MNADDPLFKKFVKGWWMKMHGGDPKEAAVELLRSMPTDEVQLLGNNPHDEPLFKRVVNGYIQRRHLRVDAATLGALSQMLQVGKQAWRSVVSYETAKHNAQRVNTVLSQEAEYQDSQHRTRMIEERVKRIRLRQEGRQATAPPTAQPAAQKPDPLERFERAVSAQFSGLTGKENAAATKIEVVQLTAEVHIKLAEAKGDQELAARLRRVRDDLIADLKTGESEL